MTQPQHTVPPGSETNINLSIIIPACNEAAYISACLAALLAQDDGAGNVEIIVAANGCSDETADVARRHAHQLEARGWHLVVLDLPDGGKLGALNVADRMAHGRARIYLDADVICAPALLGQLSQALDTDAPRYATGRLVVAPAKSRVTRAYARIWTRLPFVKGGAVGAGLFALNSAGRARWKDFPDIISDDTFVRLHFTAKERIEVPASYTWPMVEGLANLIRVRRRQDAGVAEIYRLYPTLRANEAKKSLTSGDLAALFLAAPVGFVLYILVHFAVRLRPADTQWTRGR